MKTPSRSKFLNRLNLEVEEHFESLSLLDLSHSIAIQSGLKEGRPISNRRFDLLFPKRYRWVSELHWTPISVAKRAAELLVVDDRSTILDIGCGVGKFCLVGALATQASFVGIEHREHLVRIAENAGRYLNAKRANFIAGSAFSLDWNGFDGFYLYNPYYENLSQTLRIDSALSLNEEKYHRYIRNTQTQLSMLAPGKRVVTFHGFGGKFPPNFRCIVEEAHGSGTLQLWSNASVFVSKENCDQRKALALKLF